MKANVLCIAAGLVVCASLAAGESSSSWTDRVELEGDLRFRHELITETGQVDRNRQRIRLRLGLSAEANDSFDVHVRLATGSGDPVSTNQTLDEAFSSKGIQLDQAYFDWHPETAESLCLLGGKMKNPFYMPGKSGLVWDGDLTPEGLAVGYEGGSEDAKAFAKLGYYWVEERSSANDTMLIGLQAGAKFKAGQGDLTIGAGYFNYANIAGRTALADATDGFGNSTTAVDPDGIPGNGDEYEIYDNDYDQVEAFAEYKFKAGETPVSVYADFVTNTAVGTGNIGYLFGFTVGKAKAPGTWSFGYNYRRLEADAVVGAFCDSDFAGGGTDGQGHQFTLGYALAKNAGLGVTYLYNEKGIGSGTDYGRLQVDFQLKF